jgi:hypothetical protein
MPASRGWLSVNNKILLKPERLLARVSERVADKPAVTDL